MDRNEKLPAFDTSMETYFKAIDIYKKGEVFRPESLAERFYPDEHRYVIKGHVDIIENFAKPP
jgi:hypothetical protein